MAVDLRIVGGRDGAWLRVRLRRVLRLLGVRRGEWTIAVVGDREMVALHERTMGIGTTTDVLTFDMREKKTRNAKLETRNGGAQDVGLDTMVCVDEAGRRARELGHTVREELLLYCVHSLLHVQGYDDVRAGGKWGGEAMHRREDELLVAVGVGAVYGAARNIKRESRNAKQITGRKH